MLLRMLPVICKQILTDIYKLTFQRMFPVLGKRMLADIIKPED